MKYRVVTDGGAVVGLYEAASEDEVLEQVAADKASGYATHEAAENAALAGVLSIEAAD